MRAPHHLPATFSSPPSSSSLTRKRSPSSDWSLRRVIASHDITSHHFFLLNTTHSWGGGVRGSHGGLEAPRVLRPLPPPPAFSSSHVDLARPGILQTRSPPRGVSLASSSACHVLPAGTGRWDFAPCVNVTVSRSPSLVTYLLLRPFPRPRHSDPSQLCSASLFLHTINRILTTVV